MADIKVERHVTITIPNALQRMLEQLWNEVCYEIDEDEDYFPSLCMDIAQKFVHSTHYGNTDIKYVE